MRYSKITYPDINNGLGCRVSIFIQGCSLHCKNCFNKELWDFNKGKEFTKEDEEYLFSLCEKSYISGLSILGGEPTESPIGLYKLVKDFKEKFPNKTIWLYSGYTYEQLKKDNPKLFNYIDVLVDGPFIEELKDPSLPFRGSSNQNIINIIK